VVADVKDGIPKMFHRRKRGLCRLRWKLSGVITFYSISVTDVSLLYAHLQPQSLKVKVGDKVKLGQTLGLVGNSGNSDLPHLHFHIVNAASPLAAEGVPYVFKSFVMQGALKSNAEIVRDGFKPDPQATSKRQMEIPIQNAIIIF
jgi:hypothetical protein